MRVSAYMCPNCVTPWKCNGPHIPESMPAADPGRDDQWWDLVVVFGSTVIALVSMILFVVSVVVSVKVARALGWL